MQNLHINRDEQLVDLKDVIRKHRHEEWLILFRGLRIYCRDIASFYTAAKDIFLQNIYAPNPCSDQPFFIDGGGHIGLFSLYAKKRFPDAKIIAFEPDPESYELFCRNIEANGLKDISVYPFALYSKKGKQDFASGLSDGSTLFSPSQNTTVPSVLLSDYLNARVDYLKLNIEGVELEVLREISDKLDTIDEICIEYHGFPELGQRLHSILSILDHHNFRYMIHDFDRETNPYTKPPFTVAQDTRFFLLIYAKRFATL